MKRKKKIKNNNLSKEYKKPVKIEKYKCIKKCFSKILIKNNDYSKYVDLNYTHKIWFLNVAAGAGICNGYNLGVKNIQTHLKLELNFTF